MVTVNDLTINYIENDIVLINEIDKKIIVNGAWSTIIYHYKEFDKKKLQYGKDKFTIRRYKKRNQEYKQHSKFNISNVEQAKKIIFILNNWMKNISE